MQTDMEAAGRPTGGAVRKLQSWRSLAAKVVLSIEGNEKSMLPPVSHRTRIRAAGRGAQRLFLVSSRGGKITHRLT